MLVVVEGVDGAGKTFQVEAIRKRLADLDYVVTSLSFPRYTSTVAGPLIGRYLNGDFGELDPYVAAALYAADRQQSEKFLRTLLQHSDIVLVDRYVDSNIAHQCARVPAGPARDALQKWIINLEYAVNKLRQPDLRIILDVPMEVAVERIAKKSKRPYTDKAADKHESDVPYLTEVQGIYRGMQRSGVVFSDLTVAENVTGDCVKAIRQQFHIRERESNRKLISKCE